MSGWIKLHRSIINWEWYEKPKTLSLFIHFLLKANHKEKKWQGTVIKQGSFISSRNKLSEETGLSVGEVRHAINNLQKSGNVTTKATNKYTLYTISNYENYQYAEKEQPAKQPANNPQSNRLATTNKNVKKEKNEKKQTYTRKKFGEYKHILLEKVQHKKLLDMWGHSKFDFMVKVMDESIEEKGNIYKIKNFYLALLKWEKKQNNIPMEGTFELNKNEIKLSKSMIKTLTLSGVDLGNLNRLVHTLYLYRKNKRLWLKSKPKLSEHSHRIINDNLLDTTLFGSYALWISTQVSSLPNLKKDLMYFSPGTKSFNRYIDYYIDTNQMNKSIATKLKEVE